MYSFHITDLVYIIYAYLPYAAYYQAKKSWVNKVFMIEIIFILILINTFTVLDASNNPVLRIVAVCSGSIFSILALRYWYSAKKSFQRKEIVMVSIILGIVTLQVMGMLHPYIFLLIYILLPLLYWKQISKCRNNIASAFHFRGILGQGSVSTLAIFDPKVTGFYTYTSTIVAIQMIFAAYLYIKQKWAKIIQVPEVQTLSLGFFFISDYIKEQRSHYTLSKPRSLIPSTSSFHHSFHTVPSFRTYTLSTST